MNIGFHIDQHDKDGYVWDSGIFLWFDDAFCLKVDNMDALNLMIDRLKKVRQEILEDYGYIE